MINPSYSVILPTYNRGHQLGEAIKSVIAQDYDNFEIIVIDDGSTDQTHQVVKQFGSCCRYEYQPNQGPAAARNRAIELAQGDLLALLDSDDLWLPGKIATELNQFERYPDVDCLAGNGDLFFQGEYKTSSIFAQRQIHFDGIQSRYFDWSFHIMPFGPACVTSAMTLRNSVLQTLRAPLFDNGLRFDEDWDLEFRLFLSCKVLFYKDIVCRNRIEDDGTREYYSIWGRQKPMDEWRRIWQVQIAILDRYLDHPNWDTATRKRFRARRAELMTFLQETAPQHHGWLNDQISAAAPA